MAVERYPASRYSLVELRPETGRKHQLRVHMAALGAPLLHDRSYPQLLDPAPPSGPAADQVAPGHRAEQPERDQEEEPR